MSSVDDLLRWDQNFYDDKLADGSVMKELQVRGRLNSGKEIDYALGLQISAYWRATNKMRTARQSG